MDFFEIKERQNKKKETEIYPDFIVRPSADLMIRGGAFYAVWDDKEGRWSTNEYDVARLVDAELREYAEEHYPGFKPKILSMKNFSSNSWATFKHYMKVVGDTAHVLDNKITFLNTEVKKTDYVSKRLSYDPIFGPIESYDELMSVLYSDEERQKFEWAIGSILSGYSTKIQKFLVFFGEMGTGKSTVLNIIQDLFESYCIMFDAKALGSGSNTFAAEIFKNNPLVAIQHDGDLSRIEDNSKLNSIISHENIVMNEKFKSAYNSKMNAMLFMGTNRPVKITDSKSGLIRRLIDIRPTGNKISAERYDELMSRIQFEKPAIANHCMEVFGKLGKNYYNHYRPIDMILQTDTFYNFVESSYFVFKNEDMITLKQAYEMYKAYCTEACLEFKSPRHKFREELKDYFTEFMELTRIDGKQVRSVYKGFRVDKFDEIFSSEKKENKDEELGFIFEESILDKELSECYAQYSNENGIPTKKWDNVRTKLSDLDTKKEHYVKPPDNHIVIDFDLKDKDGNKSRSLNLEAASKWPKTYGEFSKSGSGVHLHYIYDGDVEKLKSIYDENIEIKIFTKGRSLRRKLSYCNNIPIATLFSGSLPIKGDKKKMVNFEGIRTEKLLRDQINKCLRKEIHPNTAPNVSFIKKLLDDAYFSGMKYDVTDMRQKILTFALHSTNQKDKCISMINDMHFQSEEQNESDEYKNDDIVFFDLEVFPNLLLINWKYQGEDKAVVRMINPSPKDLEPLMKSKLIGFNNRRYDNHILYGRYIGYSNDELYKLSQRLINNSRQGTFMEAYKLSYADIYDFSSKKQSLKKWEIELGIHHKELGLPWDEPVPEDKWLEVAEYCDNDVLATEEVFNYLKADWVARLILSELSGLTPNDTTQHHVAKILFGDDPHPQDKFIYTDLSEMFPGYVFENGKSTYRDEIIGEGGYVYAEPGMYKNVVLLDIQSMHPTSLEQLKLFGEEYTERFSEIKRARIAIKHHDYDSARKMLNGMLGKYLKDESEADKLSYALKIIINIVYGLTSAKFESKFFDKRNKDNIVAKRGALFMVNLKHEVQERGYIVAHIKTDSIKIPNADKKIIDFVMDYGLKYGYIFEHEATYDRMCLVNDAVYIAKYNNDSGKHSGQWTPTGAQFAHPYVFKTLFSKENLTYSDLCEAKNVNTAMYLDMNEGLKDDEHNYIFVGKTGLFSPIKNGFGGGELVRLNGTKYDAVVGTKGYRWLESETVKSLNKENDIDKSYFNSLADEAKDAIDVYGDFDKFVSDGEEFSNACMQCGKYDCMDKKGNHCIHEISDEFHMECEYGYDIYPF